MQNYVLHKLAFLVIVIICMACGIFHGEIISQSGSECPGNNSSPAQAMWVVGGTDNITTTDEIRRSTDGITWPLVGTFPTTIRRHVMIFFNNYIWSFGGIDNGGTMITTVYRSSNGINWSAVGTMPARQGGPVLIHNCKLWYFMGSNTNTNAGAQNTALTSSDGINWTVASTMPGANNASSALSYRGRIYVIGGQDAANAYRDHIFISSDGLTWSTATLTIAVPGMAYMGYTIFNNEMWLVGGRYAAGAGNVEDEAWRSTDGVSWTTPGVLPALRTGDWNTLVNYNGFMYWLGGGDAGSAQEEVYRSSNGAAWAYIGDLPLQTRAGGIFTF